MTGAGSDRARDAAVLRLFEEALEQPPDTRARWLAALDAPAEVRAAVDRLLAREADGTDLPTPALPAGFSRPVDLPPGTRVGDFVVTSLIGAGGMGRVFLATQDQPSRRVALKVLERTAGTRPRFEEEAAILARMRHPGVAQVHAAGTLPETLGGRPWLAMEFVAGALPFDRWVAERRPDRALLLDVFGQVCEAVHHAHQRGVIHRDLKGPNVLVDEDDRPKVIDFGVARLAGEDRDATRAGDLVGSLVCMAPEQVDGDPGEVDTRADVHALGVLLYTAVCGRPPRDLDALTWTQRVRQIAEHPPTPPGPEVEADLAAVLMTALAVDREQRYPSAAALAADVARFARHEPVVARPPGPWHGLVLLARRRRAAVAVSAVLLLSLLAALALAAHAAREARRAELDALAAQGHAERARAEAESARGEAEAQADLAERRRLAADAARLAEQQQRERAEGLVSELAGTNIGFVLDTAQAFGQLPGATELKARFTQRAVQDLEALQLSDPALRLQVAHAQLLVGDVLGRPQFASLGRRDEALQLYATARTTIDELVAHDEVGAYARLLRGLFAVRVGDMALSDGRLDEALQLYEQLRDSLTGAFGSDVPHMPERARNDIISALLGIGTAHGLAGDHVAAGEVFAQAERHLAPLLEQRDDDPTVWKLAGHVRGKQGSSWLRQRRLDLAESSYAASIAAYERSIALNPSATGTHWSQAQSRIALAETRIQAERFAEALEVVDQAAAALRWLARVDPSNVGFATNLCDALYNRAWALHAWSRGNGPVSERLARLDEAELLLEDVADRLSRVPLPSHMAGAPATVAARLADVRAERASLGP